ncbi:hypothetical protein WMF20_45175 [Sorangium sp. So ce834]|uniref:hypothetical protein n=1 Tax=Sorangium sp. So ce834 TaxID=3133321 RepID=UPI003F5E3436
MKVTPIENPLAGERVVAVHPALAPQVDGGWRRRLHLYTGRTLSDTALQAEQQGRAGRLATLGQVLSPGVVTGLEIDLELRAPSESAPEGRAFLHVAPGMGLAPSGEDVVLPRALRVDVAHLRAPPGSFGTSPDDASPRIPPGTRLGVLVLQPSVVRGAGNLDPTNPCDYDETEGAFADEQTIDAARLLLLPWNPGWAELPESGSAWRNQIAFAIFELERLQGSEEQHPWEVFGVPIGLLAFEDAVPVWVDRYSVVRQGGKAKRRRPFVTHDALRTGTPFLWQARIQQFAEQLAGMPPLDPVFTGQHIAQFAALPPAGMLPREAISFDPLGSAANRFFPAGFRIKAAPLPLEQLDQVIQRCASLAPLDTASAEDVLVIAPVPQAVYEPRLLIEEQVDPIFQRSIDWFQFERHGWRFRRALLRRDHAALVRAADGDETVPVYPDPDPEAIEQPELPALPGRLPETLPAPATLQDYLRGLPPPPEPNDPPTQAWEGEERYGVEGADQGVVRAMEDLRVALGITEYEDEDPESDPGDSKPVPTKKVRRGRVFSKEEIDDLESGMGLDAFIKKIEAKLAKADDTIDFSFLKGHANIYRLRQFMLGNIAATRLASSPILTSIAKGASAAAVTDEVNKFYLSVKGKPPPGTVVPPGTAAPPKTGGTPKPQPRDLERREAVPGGATPSSRVSGAVTSASLVGSTLGASSARLQPSGAATAASLLASGRASSATTSWTSIAGALSASPGVASSSTGIRPPSGVAGASLVSPELFLPPSAFQPTPSATLDPGVIADLITAGALLGGGGLQFQPSSVLPSTIYMPPPPARDIVQKDQPIVGEGAYDFRTVSIAERIEASPGRDSKNYAVAARTEALEAIRLLSDEKMNIEDIPVFGVPEWDKNRQPLFHLPFLSVKGEEIEKEEEGAVANPRAGLVKRLPAPVSLGRVFKSKTFGGIERILRDPAGKDADEGNLYSDAALIVEHAIATLRAVEARIVAYRADLERCRQALRAIDQNKDAAARRLAVIGGELGEVRHKLATTRALLRDEQDRVGQINQRRAKVLSEHLGFLAYVRPRFAEAMVDAPMLSLNPGVFAAPVPACLNAHSDAPEEIDEMVQLLREAPVSWFTDVPRILDKLDRVELLHGTLAIAKMRAQVVRVTEVQPATFRQRALPGRFGQAIVNVTQAQQRAVGNVRLQVAQLDLARFVGLGWKETREHAKHVLSLGDLIEANHGRSLVADAAARELSQIGRIAGCLHAQASDVLPAIRLEWAERLSQYEGENVRLRNLAALPRWGEIPYVDRKEIEGLVDWLYSRIDTAHAEALAWMNDLVRVCLLLASHAPVDEIIAGAVVDDTPVHPGKTVPVAIDPIRVRLGMKVMFFKGQEMVAHGVVEDLVGNQARARVAEASAQLVLPKGATARFVDPMARTAPSFFRKA